MQTQSKERRRVLVAVDGSDASERVVEFVNHFFADLDVEMIGINVGEAELPWIPMGPAVGTPFAWPYVGAPPTSTPEERAQRKAEAASEVASSGLIADEIVAEVGDPVERICTVAIERVVDLVVVGDTHRSLWHRLLEGSVTTDLQARAQCPVLVVP